eukprot:gene26023-11722_t
MYTIPPNKLLYEDSDSEAEVELFHRADDRSASLLAMEGRVAPLPSTLAIPATSPEDLSTAPQELLYSPYGSELTSTNIDNQCSPYGSELLYPSGHTSGVGMQTGMYTVTIATGTKNPYSLYGSVLLYHSGHTSGVGMQTGLYTVTIATETKVGAGCTSGSLLLTLNGSAASHTETLSTDDGNLFSRGQTNEIEIDCGHDLGDLRSIGVTLLGEGHGEAWHLDSDVSGLSWEFVAQDWVHGGEKGSKMFLAGSPISADHRSDFSGAGLTGSGQSSRRSSLDASPLSPNTAGVARASDSGSTGDTIRTVGPKLAPPALLVLPVQQAKMYYSAAGDESFELSDEETPRTVGGTSQRGSIAGVDGLSPVGEASSERGSVFVGSPHDSIISPSIGGTSKRGSVAGVGGLSPAGKALSERGSAFAGSPHGSILSPAVKPLRSLGIILDEDIEDVDTRLGAVAAS